MERAFILLIATVTLFVTPGVQAVLTPANNTQVNITRAGCGKTKLCVETPGDCDPAGQSNCLFGSLNASAPTPPKGVDVSFQLSGNSTGYIALGLTNNASQGNTTLFVCAKINNTFQFMIRSRNNVNEMLSSLDRNVTEIRGTAEGQKIQCEFDVPGLNASATRNTDTSFIILLGFGTVNNSTLGPFTVNFTSSLLNISDPASNLANAGNTCGVPSQVMLFLVSILTMSFLKTM